MKRNRASPGRLGWEERQRLSPAARREAAAAPAALQLRPLPTSAWHAGRPHVGRRGGGREGQRLKEQEKQGRALWGEGRRAWPARGFRSWRARGRVLLSPESLRLDPKALCRLETYSSPGAPALCGEKGLGEPWGLRGP